MVAGVAVAFAGEGPILQATLDAGYFGLHLTEGRTGVCRLSLGVATLVSLGVKGGGESGYLVLKLDRVEVGLRQLMLGLLYFLLDVGEFAFEGKWALRACTTTRDRDVVEGLAGG